MLGRLVVHEADEPIALASFLVLEAPGQELASFTGADDEDALTAIRRLGVASPEPAPAVEGAGDQPSAVAKGGEAGQAEEAAQPNC